MSLSRKELVLDDIDYLRQLVEEFWYELNEKEQTVVYNGIVRGLNKMHGKFGPQI